MGNNSYKDGAGLFRISNFAKYVKFNMPLGATHQLPILSDEEAWDIAAFVNTQARPHIDVPKDWPDVSKKPIDHPFGPYSDNFSELQHKFGPFKPIEEVKKKKEMTNKKITAQRWFYQALFANISSKKNDKWFNNWRLIIVSVQLHQTVKK